MKSVKLSELTKDELSLLEEAKLAAQKYFNKKNDRRVGAVLLCEDGSVYSGTNIRRINVSNSTCAERMALDRAMFDQKYEYKTLVIIGYHKNTKSDELTSPCGLCRQILYEAACNGKAYKPFLVIMASPDFSSIVKTDIQELFPFPYHGKEK